MSRHTVSGDPDLVPCPVCKAPAGSACTIVPGAKRAAVPWFSLDSAARVARRKNVQPHGWWWGHTKRLAAPPPDPDSLSERYDQDDDEYLRRSRERR